MALIGAGNAGEAIISGLLKSNVYTSKDIQVAEINDDRRKYISQTYQVTCFKNSRDILSFSDIVIIAVKPINIMQVLQDINSFVKTRKVVLSIVAGIPIAFIKKHLSQVFPIIRGMPNLACSVGEAMITITPAENVIEHELKIATDVLELLGQVMILEEKYLNLATALNGSGPAYIFLIIEALADAGVRVGLPKDISIMLAAQTTLGAAKMVVDTGEHPAKLKDKVATPGGTTVEGLLKLEDGKLRAVIISAVTEATQKARALIPT